MKILILGGTVFLGRALVDSALGAGHEVTLFNRGTHSEVQYPGVEQLHGDRTQDLTPLHGREWDAVIDTSGYHPDVVRASARLLAKAVKHYTFISSKSAYADFSQPGVNESSPVATLTAEQLASTEQMQPPYGEFYGPLKALCEQAVEEEMPGRVLNLRPGLIVGPYDGSDRFTYWPVRVARGGEVLAPGRPDKIVQFIDVRDFAAWIVSMVEAGQTGVYNVNRPGQLTMQQVLEECKSVSGSNATFTWVNDAFLNAHEVGAWMELPLWIPDSDAEMAGFLRASVARALEAGLTFRPLATTIEDTLAWDRTRGAGPRRAGMAPDRETQLLALWHQQPSA
ncbi:NAD-dependent epimerase/dehydratase family protein [Dictyobacter kobayashii]|uniref:NAD-dependent epimerase/dehydratase domain-containing protein n=1 Tax=Dictyobacter kobayashii TaxID=2014872 RepID=A0A402AV12_9CHLR|nr:NAD-dependent epimerase/dehydratase family protein [Dictyobacter kobayashii]GCE22899.1 hypothetical protein KDK_66990 [Dictyobacter kobayashii]